MKFQKNTKSKNSRKNVGIFVPVHWQRIFAWTSALVSIFLRRMLVSILQVTCN